MKKPQKKSVRHKEQNTFKYKSFNERIGEISVDSRQHLLGSTFRPTAEESYFFETYNKWLDLNRTQHFSDFQKDVRGKIQSYSLLVHHQSHIVESLKRHLRVQDSLALEPLLELVTNLAKDVQEDFYQFFGEFFQIFIDHLFPSADPEVLEWTFGCLCSLFKVLKRPMLKDLQNVFRMMIPLLSAGQKPYIIRFATESFAFLIRSYKDNSGIIEFLLMYCNKTPELSAGIGELLFETVKNVDHHLHVIFEKMFPALLDKLEEEPRQTDSVTACVESLVEHLTAHVTRDTSVMFWNVFLGSRQMFLCIVDIQCKSLFICVLQPLLWPRDSLSEKKMGSEVVRNCSFHIIILRGWIVRKSGSLVVDPTAVVEVVLKLLGADHVYTEEISEDLVKISVNLLQLSQINVDVYERRKLIRAVFNGCVTVSQKLKFAELLVDLPLYEVEILPNLLQFCLESLTEDTLNSCLHVLVAVVLRRDPRQFYNDNLLSWRPYPLDFSMAGGSNTTASAKLAEFLRFISAYSDRLSSRDEAHWSILWALAVLLPHIRPRPSSDVLNGLRDHCLETMAILNSGTEIMVGRLFGLMLQFVHASVIAIASLGFGNLSQIFENGKDILKKFPTNVCLLSAASIYLDVSQGDEQSRMELPLETLTSLKVNLRNPSHAIRRATIELLLHSFSSEQKRFFEICLLAENVEASIQEYREKLRFLRMLGGLSVNNLLTDSKLLDMPILYLFGCLKIGFQPVWKEVKELIASYAPRLSMKVLWSVVSTELETASAEAESLQASPSNEEPVRADDLSRQAFSHYLHLTQDDSKSLDPHKYRIQLWQSCAEMVDAVEPKNRVFSELLQRFLRNEFFPTTLSGDFVKVTAELTNTRKFRQNAEETLCVMLELFCKFRNPRALYQEPTLRLRVLELLTYRSPKVQSLVLQYLFRYKMDHLVPYEHHLMNLLEEKEMWNTLVEIELGAPNPAIEQHHRPLVVPIIVRLLFGRMQLKSKRSNTEKGAPRGRKEAIVRSLANCQTDEFALFLDLVLKPFDGLFECEVLEITTKILRGEESPQLSLKLADGVLRTLYIILDELRSVAAHSIHRIFHALVGVLSVLVCKRQNKLDAENNEGKVNMMKKLKKEIYRCLCLIGTVFPISTFSVPEQQALLKSAVWPEIDNILRDGASTPTSLMRLLMTWSRQPSYHLLLAAPNDSGITPLSALVSILGSAIPPKAVSTNMVTEILNNLLSPPMESEESEPREENGLAAGRHLLVPHTEIILRYLYQKLTASLGKKNQKISPLTDSELKIACGISTFELRGDQAQQLVEVLLPFLTSSQLKKDADLLRLLEIVSELVRHVSKDYLLLCMRPVVSLLSRKFPRDCRTVLCDILKGISAQLDVPLYTALVATASDLLAWNPKHIDEPDYDRRVSAYKTARQKVQTLDSSDQDVDFALMVLHIASFDIQKAVDLASGSLRSLGGMSIVQILSHYSQSVNANVILEHLLPLLKNALRDQQELSLQCLRNPEDQEADVLENLRHIQKHRVGRAFHRLATLTETGEIPVSTITQFFLPLATVHLCNEQYSGEKMQGLINAVIELVYAVSRKLTWVKYEPLLKHFLNMMSRKPLYQKQLIRVVVAVVDAFHFDLSVVDLEKHEGAGSGKSIKGQRRVKPVSADVSHDGQVDPTLTANEIPVESQPGDKIRTTEAKAEKIYRSLTKFILPGLSRLITDKGINDDRHRLTADISAGEKTELMRAPVALAVVKLLQKLPEKIMQRQISSVFLKIASFLKSRLLSVRQTTRETLTEIMLSLGPSYLALLIRELKGVLKRGYQIHILVHSVHLMLTRMLPILKVGDLDAASEDLVQICHEEMFGELSEEKEVTALTRKIAEARTIKAYDTYAILAKFASPGILVKLIKPLKQTAEETQSHKISVKLEKALRQILSGLVHNAQLNESDLLLFAYALYDHSTGIFGGAKPKKLVPELPSHLIRSDCLLIPMEPKRSELAPVGNKKTNEYLLHDFLLQILLSCFKNGRFDPTSEEHSAKLDAFVPLLKHFLSSKDIKVVTSALRCYVWFLKFKLPSLNSSLESVVRLLFVHLKNYSGPGAAVGENADLVIAVYKALSASIRDGTSHQVSDKHLKVLLTYAENDFREGTKQVLAFNLLKAVLSRHLLTSELRDMMLTLASTSIQGEQENLRLQCRQLVQTFLTTYNAKKIKAKEFIELYQDNLQYPLEHGRLVSLTMLRDISDKMGEGFLKENALSFFQLFAARLSDESIACRQTAAAAISHILEKVDAQISAQIYNCCHQWIMTSEASIRSIGLQACSLLVTVQKGSFSVHLPEILPQIKNITRNNRDSLTEESTKQNDHLLINALTLFLNIETHCGVRLWQSAEYSKHVNELLVNVRDLCLHEHEWVRIRSLEAFQKAFEQQLPQDLRLNIAFAQDYEEKIKLLAEVLIHQLKSYSEREDYYVAWSGCIVYLMQAVPVASGIKEMNGNKLKKEEEDDIEEPSLKGTNARQLTLLFLVRSVCREAVYEALNEPRRTTKRLQVMKWIRKICAVFDGETFVSFLSHVLEVIYRCAHEPSAQKDEVLKVLTAEVSVAVEKHVGREEYADKMKSVISRSSNKRAERKKRQAVEPILNPEKFARKRIKKQQTKKDAKKRKHQDVELGRAVKQPRSKIMDLS